MGPGKSPGCILLKLLNSVEVSQFLNSDQISLCQYQRLNLEVSFY